MALSAPVDTLMDRVLNALADSTCTLKEACEMAGVSVAAHYYWIKHPDKFPGYKEGYELALRLRTRGLEDILNRRAVDGYDETKTTYTVLPDGTEIPVEKVVTRRFDNALALRLLSANDERYNPKIKTEVTNNTTVAEILAARRRVLAAKEKNASEEAEATTED